MVSVIRTNSNNKDFIGLIHQLDEELNQRNGSIQSIYHQFNRIENINTVVVAYVDNAPVGCGCLKKYDDETIEIKRMFVKPENRGMGISKLILNELERWGSELSFTKSILETGMKQLEAIGLYEKTGYFRIDNYGQYVGMGNSVCFQKNLKNQGQGAGK